MKTLRTQSGRIVSLENPQAKSIHQDDIIYPLSRIGRFNSQTFGGNFSVAQHCCDVANQAIAQGLGEGVVKHALLHDAHEAYLGDWTLGFQETLPMEFYRFYKDSCEKFDVAIFEYFELEFQRVNAAIVKELDTYCAEEDWEDIGIGEKVFLSEVVAASQYRNMLKTYFPGVWNR